MDSNEALSPRGGRFAHSKQDIRVRTRAYALRIIRLFRALPRSHESQIMGGQLLRCGISVGAHIAEACRAKSKPDFTSKIDGAMQELEESIYWMDLLVDAEIVKCAKLAALQSESTELMAILATMVKRTRLA
jgi:four helix bundle protein